MLLLFWLLIYNRIHDPSVSQPYTYRMHSAWVHVCFITDICEMQRNLDPKVKQKWASSWWPSDHLCAAHWTAADLQRGTHTNATVLGCDSDHPLIMIIMVCWTGSGRSTVCVFYDTIMQRQAKFWKSWRIHVTTLETMKQTFFDCRAGRNHFYSISIQNKQCCRTTCRGVKVCLVLYLSLRKKHILTSVTWT